MKSLIDSLSTEMVRSGEALLFQAGMVCSLCWGARSNSLIIRWGPKQSSHSTQVTDKGFNWSFG